MTENRLKTFADVVAFAIGREIEAAEGYARMAELAQMPGLREFCLFLKGQEESHRRLLEGLTDDVIRRLEPTFVPDLHIVDLLAEEKPAGDMTIQEFLIFASGKEKRAAELYESLARTAEDPRQQQLFRFLAGQEREHKLMLEAEYEKVILQEN